VVVTQRRIEVEIEEVVLHGFGPLDRPAVGAALEAELARLLSTRESDLRARRVTVHDAGILRLSKGQGELALGRSLARATHDAVRGGSSR
jgi:hypothetical protein